MTNKKGSFIGRSWIVLAVAVCLAFFAALVSIDGVAHADPAAPSDVEIVTQPTDINVVYDGEERELSVELNYDVTARYFWYRSETPSAAATLVEGGSAQKPALTVKHVSDSGYYRCEVTAISYGNGTYETLLVSDTVRVSITPKPIGVEVGETTFVYTGSRVGPELMIDEEDIEEGDAVNAFLDTEIAIKNAGTYNGTIRLDNEDYEVSGSKDATVTIEKAPLTVSIKEASVRAGREYTLELIYEGLKGSDTAEDLGFTPVVAEPFRSIKKGGTYTVYAVGESESANYVVTYGTSTLYVDEWRLEEEDISGVTADAGGTFRSDTKLTVVVSDEAPASFTFLKRVYARYDLTFTQGGADGESFIFNLKDEGLSRFCLAVCTVDEEGKTKRAEGFSYADGVLSVTIPAGKENANFVVYHDYTLLVAGSAVVLVIVIIMIISLSVSAGKYKRQKAMYTYARETADKYRYRKR